jgi:uncharacterized protein YjaZ
MKTVYIRHMFDRGDTTDPYMFGAEDLGLPLWAGYTTGYHLVKWLRVKRPELTMEELTSCPSQDFIPEFK